MTDDQKAAEPSGAESNVPASPEPAVAEPASNSVKPPNPIIGWVVVIGLAVYACFLMSLALDEVFDIGWYPTILEKQVQGQIAQLTSADKETRENALTELKDGEMFVVVPELVRELNAESPEARRTYFELLKELTPERLNIPASQYDPEGEPAQRATGRKELWRWWKDVEYDFY